MCNNKTLVFLKNYSITVDAFHAKQQAPATDLALQRLFSKYQDLVTVGDLIGEDATGYEFHKAFRTGLLPDADISMVVWFLMHDAPLYRGVLSEMAVINPAPELTRMEISELYAKK